MFKEVLIFAGGVITGAAIILGLDEKDESSWSDYDNEPEQDEKTDIETEE